MRIFKIAFFLLTVYTCLFCSYISGFCGERFQPRGCEFSVEFPEQPKIFDVVIPGVGKIENAEYIGCSGSSYESYVFMAEGMPISHDDILKYYQTIEDYLLQSTQSYARANGIEFPEFKLIDDARGYGIAMRGYKKVNGIRTIYSTMSILGVHSIITLRAGSPAHIFPPPGMVKFMKSIRCR